MSIKPLILVVDDNEHNRHVHLQHLKQAGFGVHQATSGAECLQLAAQADLVVLDTGLPDMSGIEVCQQLRLSPNTAGIPVLHMAARDDAADERTVGPEHGADAYLCIPVEPEELVATVRALLRARRAELHAQTMAVEWQLTFDTIADGICLLAEDMTIARHNRAFSAMVGPSSRLFGRRLSEVLSVDEPLIINLVNGPPGGQVDLQVGQRSFSLRVSAVQSAGLPGSKVCIISDITRIRTTQDCLRDAELRLSAHAAELESRVKARTRELNERNTELEAFTYSISHDLRAPLRTMRNFVDVLMEEIGPNLAPLHKDYLQRIDRAAQRMDNLTTDMLNYSQLGRSELVIEPVQLQALVERLVEERRERAESSTARFVIERPLPVVFASEAGLAQALGNLLDNALKFSRPGVDTIIRCSARPDGNRVEIQIEDNGIGIDPRYFKKIFLPFERLNPSQAVPGTGIGLAIVQRCIDKMGGEIDVSSIPGKGSTFMITLPAR